MKWLKRIGAVFIVIAIVFAALMLIPRPMSVANNTFYIANGQRPLLIAHGGGNREFPDNTLEAFYNAVHIDPYAMLETDVSLTKDGVILLSHDKTIDKKTNKTGKIIDLNYSDLIAEEVDFNYDNPTDKNEQRIGTELKPYKTHDGKTVLPTDVHYPQGATPRHESKFLATTLEDLITTFPNNPINVEIKQSGEVGVAALDAVIKLMENLDEEYNTFNRIVLASFHKEIYDKIKEYSESSALRFSPNEDGIIKLYVSHWFGADFIYNEPVTVLQIPMKEHNLPLDTSFFIHAAHRHNIAVHYWTIDNEDDMRKLAENGADGIMTNIPSRLKEVLDEIYGEGNSPLLFP